ncbi:DNA-binding bromodomain-containing protein [Euphorbia peplus]|nr:DNA-binding bromodomain-containing protein [Euphorbia peplus]
MQKRRRLLREGYRKSPRICALDVRKARPDPVNVNGNANANVKKPRGFTGSGKKKNTKLRPLQDVTFPHSPQDSSSNEQGDIQTSSGRLQLNRGPELPILPRDNGEKYDGWHQVTNPGRGYTMPFAQQTPDKHLLEFILDILQRRDTHEIFAEPVDPDEVEDYYEIIEEPMDFGTMRAKLHEGMYRSLEQFEHDVFLISRNAMHFNPSGTIYFRQARAIDELAKKVFHVLRTDPDNFVAEFSGTRPRAYKKAKCEAWHSTNGSSSKVATNSRWGSVTTNISRKSTPNSSNSKVDLRATKRAIPGYSSSGINIQSGMVDDEVPFGGGIGDSMSLEADRRSSYESWLSMFRENYSVVSPLYNTPQLLMLDAGYSESLMRFAKDLGPTAQMVARRKLNGFSIEANNYLSSGSIKKYAPSGISQHISTMINQSATIKTPQNLHTGHRIDMCDHANEQERAYSGDRMRLSSVNSFEPEAHGSNRISFGADRFEAEAAGVPRQETWNHLRVGNMAGVSGFGETVNTQYLRDPAAFLGHRTDWRLNSRPASASDAMYGVPFWKTSG